MSSLLGSSRYFLLSSNTKGFSAPYKLKFMKSDPYDYDSVRRYDKQLQRTLKQIFLPRNLSQIKDLISRGRGPERYNRDFIIEQVLLFDPNLSEIIPRDSGLSILWIAVLNNFHNSAEMLVRLGADVNDRAFGMSLLQLLINAFPSVWNERKILHYTLDCDICELNKIVRASRDAEL